MIEVEGLSRSYEGRPAIADLSFTVAPGQALGLVGPAGAGKSTTMRILAGCLVATSGSVVVAGHDLSTRSREARRHTGYLAEGNPLDDGVRVESFLDTLCRLRGVPRRHRRARIDGALERCGLGDRRQALIGRLPAEQRLRAGLAQAVVHDPDVLILDEPASGLDPDQAREVSALVAELRHERAVVVAGPVLEAGAVCDRVLVLREGRIVAEDTPSGPGSQADERPGREVRAVVRGDAAGAARDIRRLAGVSGVRVDELGDGTHRLTVTGDGGELQDAVARAIVQRGVGLQELSARQVRPADPLAGPGVGEAR